MRVQHVIQAILLHTCKSQEIIRGHRVRGTTTTAPKLLSRQVTLDRLVQLLRRQFIVRQLLITIRVQLLEQRGHRISVRVLDVLNLLDVRRDRTAVQLLRDGMIAAGQKTVQRCRADPCKTQCRHPHEHHLPHQLPVHALRSRRHPLRLAHSHSHSRPHLTMSRGQRNPHVASNDHNNRTSHLDTESSRRSDLGQLDTNRHDHVVPIHDESRRDSHTAKHEHPQRNVHLRVDLTRLMDAPDRSQRPHRVCHIIGTVSKRVKCCAHHLQKSKELLRLRRKLLSVIVQSLHTVSSHRFSVQVTVQHLPSRQLGLRTALLLRNRLSTPSFGCLRLGSRLLLFHSGHSLSDVTDRCEIHHQCQYKCSSKSSSHSSSRVLLAPLLQIHLRVLECRVQRKHREREKKKQREKLLCTSHSVLLPQNQRTNR
mmetsp:Transcript_82158/g.219927  ORF Transcript_82158/g.219927 Transcript_82158/m.219927 type:complete len:424 (-) Transcript_82158:600-1871(-)